MEFPMSSVSLNPRALYRRAAYAAAAVIGAAAVLFAASIAPAIAGECPEADRVDTPLTLTAPPDVGTVRQVLNYVDLTGWRGVDGLALRMRRLIVAKDGFVPLHWHDDRPSIVYVVSGEIIEHSALCKTPIVHKAGDSTPEFGPGHAHWWENKSGKEVVLISTDAVPNEMVLF